MKRRDFLKKTTATVAAGALAAQGPLFLNASDKAGSKAAVVGSGEYRYECDHHWGQLPANLDWRITHGVTVDEEGLVYIKHQGYPNKNEGPSEKPPIDTIVVFDKDGKFVRSFGKDIYPGGHGIDIRKEGGEQFLYLCDRHHR